MFFTLSMLLGFRDLMMLLEVEKQLKEWLSNVKKLVILGVGNPLRHDDGFGPALIEAVSKYKLPDKVKLINCETVPENFLNTVIRLEPSHVIIVDSAQMNALPGEVKLVSPENIGGITFSTHTLPLTFLSPTRLNAPTGQKLTQIPQLLHLSSQTMPFSFRVSADFGHTPTQPLHLRHFFLSASIMLNTRFRLY